MNEEKKMRTKFVVEYEQLKIISVSDVPFQQFRNHTSQ